MGKVPGVNGNTYSVFIDLQEGYVRIGDEFVTQKIDEARLFAMAYRLGRDHKKTEIRNALNI